MGVDLPRVPSNFQAHKTNYERLRSTNLDWSMLCPGPMVAAENGKLHDGLRVSTDVWPVDRPAVTKFQPPIALSLAFRIQAATAVLWPTACDKSRCASGRPIPLRFA